MAQRRAYRVVFTPAPDQRTGTIVARTAEAAHAEARRVAADGGTAVVVYVHDNGERDTLAHYDPRTP